MNKIELEYNDEGQLFFRRARSEMYGSGFYSHFQKELERITGPAGRGVMYQAAKESALKGVRRYKKRQFATNTRLSPKRQLDFLIKEIPMRGYGQVLKYEFDTKKISGIIQIKGCFNAKEYYDKAKNPVCYAMAGLSAGAVEGTFGKEVRCIETKCIAIKDPYCEFVMQQVKK